MQILLGARARRNDEMRAELEEQMKRVRREVRDKRKDMKRFLGIIERGER